VSRIRNGSVLAAVGAVALAVTVSAFGGNAAAAQRVAVDMSEFKFAVKPKTAKVGVVVFAVANKGSISHDFRIAGRKTPVLAAGKSGTLKVTFKKAGRYPFLCTLPSHAAAGMKGVLIVK
jgi:uncharacterized cupredoxin-like copper-binding protein